MGIVKRFAKWIHKVMPDGDFKRKLSAFGYRRFYGKALKTYRYEKGVFTAVFRDGIEVKSIADFDPEAIITNLLDCPVEEGWSVMDWGGHYGLVSVYLSKKVGPSGKVFVFEADPKNYEILKKNLELNGVTNTLAIEKGVFDQTGFLEFYSGGGYTSSFQKTDYVERDQERYVVARVPVVSLDEAAAEIGLDRLNLIKIDIEGSELPALKGAKASLVKFHPLLLIETHVVNGEPTADNVIGLLKTVGYEDIVVENTYYGLPFIRAI